ncbi:IclR family transcriptional regulator domain-containing protein [Bacillus sp. JJ1566]|uniref:IclR family transcriptional regulator domain-containing protein n=1 Tax=Bacillus sp. JJ1566 TaxID=3122961 RepID=UPI003F68A593
MEAITIGSFTHGTITHKNDFKNNLRIIREKGYSFDNKERIEGLKCITVRLQMRMD